MSKEKNVIEFYMLCNKLKDIVRTGWKDWNVQRERLESIAEHIFGTQMLAISMWSEFEYKDLDIKKVFLMLALHETEETVIGDKTCFQISKEEKQELGHKAIKEIFSKLNSGEDLEKLVFEFDERKTPEARFAYFCDKLECVIQCKVYDEENCFDLSKQEENETYKLKEVNDLVKNEKRVSNAWIKFWDKRVRYDKNFEAVSKYIYDNKL